MIDSHCHLDIFRAKEIPTIVERAKKEGIKAIVDPASTFSSNKKIQELAKEYNGFVYPAYGMHPTDCVKEGEKIDELIAWMKEQTDFVAVGEVGLDYHWIKNENEREKEKGALKKFMALASEMGKPMIIHSREAIGEILEMLERFEGTVIMHYFSGSLKVAKECVDRGYYLSFCNTIALNPPKRIIKSVPLENMLVESDSPFGRKGNVPWNVWDAVRTIAYIKDTDIKEVEVVIEKNFEKAFGVRI